MAQAPLPLSVQCCVAGGGPAGMMLGFLLARAGLEVLVLEKHGDFLRDFRGDTIHPSTLELMHELGLLEAFLELPHQTLATISAQVGDTVFQVADFTHLPVRCPYIAMLPQWDFLDFLARQGKRYPNFHLRMNATAVDLIMADGRVAGLSAATPDGEIEVRADLVVAADGRQSVLRRRAGLKVRDLGAPMDVLWFRMPRRGSDPDETMGRFDAGRLFIMINRGDYWQCAYVIAKDSLERVQAAGLPAFRDGIVRMAPFLAGREGEIGDWDAVKLLTVRVDRLRRWYRPGLICIGDAAHAMSPIGGVGINLAIQDAVAAANLLAAPLRRGMPGEADLRRVQRRRELPARLTQRMQILAQNRIIAPVLRGSGPLKPPLALRLLARYPLLRRLPARLIGMGLRPEHVATPDAGRQPDAS